MATLATHPRRRTLLPLAALVLTALSLGGCGSFSTFGSTAQLSERECLARVMYFESNRSSDDGMLAVGTVVMNRLQSPKYPKTVCGVVGQRNQFAEGALSKPVSRRSQSWTRAERAADAVLSGERHAGVGTAMFFHTAGYTFPYNNMHYLTLAGGNAFYEKKTPGTFTPGLPWAGRTMVADARPVRASEPAAERVETPRAVQLASVEADEDDAPAAPVRRATPRAGSVERTGLDDGEADVEPIVRRPRPVVVAEAPVRLDPTRLEPISPGYSRPPVARPIAIAAAPPARTSRPVTLAAAEPPARPRPIVLAMLSEPKSRPARAPRSIEDLIAMDLQQR